MQAGDNDDCLPNQKTGLKACLCKNDLCNSHIKDDSIKQNHQSRNTDGPTSTLLSQKLSDLNSGLTISTGLNLISFVYFLITFSYLFLDIL